ncbi:hypothetical protein ZIOFF_006176 [Zingiber officinale]|uniref:X8 domain-containing protein n=1 Tax=Zingiber officinale TaxID=94328 RepID=A0A8J5IC60_ZINOF|nr:hypothetical protein ZIOFF_006176 [Zingiber officinale]
MLQLPLLSSSLSIETAERSKALEVPPSLFPLPSQSWLPSYFSSSFLSPLLALQVVNLYISIPYFFLLQIVFPFFFFFSFVFSDAAWCVCRSDMSTTALQKTLDFACGAGADCTPILQNGACYNPNTVLAHCSYAANSYYQRKGQAQDACDFSGTAVLSSTDPGGNGCSYTATPSALGSSTTPTTPEGASSMPTNSSSFTPSTTTGTGGVFGVVPTGTGNFDASDAALLPNKMLIMPSLLFMFTALFASLENFI